MGVAKSAVEYIPVAATTEDAGASDVAVSLTEVSWLTTSIFELLLQAVAVNPKAMKTITEGEKERFTASD